MRWWRGSGGSGDTPCYLRTSYNPILQFIISINKLLIVIFHVCKYMYIVELTTFMYVRLTLQAVGV